MAITLSEAKLHCRIEQDEDDALVSDLIVAAVAHIERITGWVTNPQNFQKPFKNIDKPMRLPHWPVTAVTAIEQVGTSTVNVAANFDVDLTSRPARVTLYDALTLDRGEVIRISYTAGETDLPDELKQAALMLVAHWYENREAVAVGTISADVAMGVNRLLSQFIGLRLS